MLDWLRAQILRILRNSNIQVCALCGQTSVDTVCDVCQQQTTDLTGEYHYATTNLLLHPAVKTKISCKHYEILKVMASYDYPWSFYVKQFKFHHQLQFGQLLANQFYQRLLIDGGELPELLIPVPLHPKRYLHRQFNQSTELVNTLAKLLSLPVDYHCLQRVKHATPQSAASGVKRRARATTWFKATDNITVTSVALVDDVMTTGETIDACCAALKQQLPHVKIHVWVMCLRIFV